MRSKNEPKMYKKSELEFDVIYEDGSRKRVKDGILFAETESHTLDMHLGTYNQLGMFTAIYVSLKPLVERYLKEDDKAEQDK
jgi:hypothetical protein